MADLVLAAAAVTLVLIFFRVRRAGRSYAILREWEEESLAVPLAPAPSFGVTLEDMSGLVNELAPTLRPASRVAAPQSATFPTQNPAEAGHIWSSPCGKRVYIN